MYVAITGVSPHIHLVVKHVKTGRSGKRRIAPGNRWKGRRDRDNQVFPQAARPRKEGGKRRSTPALLIGIIPSSFVGLDSFYGGSEPQNQPIPAHSPGSCWCGGTCADQVDLALLLPTRANLAAVLSLHKTDANPPMDCKKRGRLN